MGKSNHQIGGEKMTIEERLERIEKKLGISKPDRHGENWEDWEHFMVSVSLDTFIKKMAENTKRTEFSVIYEIAKQLDERRIGLNE